MKYSELISSQNMMEFIIMAAVHILIFGEMARFKIVPFIAKHMKMKNNFHGAMKKKKKFSQSELVNLHENNWY